MTLRLLKEWYDPKETVQILNERLKPTLLLNPGILSELVEADEINCKGWFEFENGKEIRFSIVENFRTAWVEYAFIYLELSLPFKDRVQAAKEWRRTSAPAKASHGGKLLSVPFGTMIYFHRTEIEEYVLKNSTTIIHKGSADKPTRLLVDWNVRGKARKIELGDACGLLAGIDLKTYRELTDYYDRLGRGADCDGIAKFHADAWNRLLDVATSRLLEKNAILQVAHNHIESGCFVDIDHRAISHTEAQKSSPHSELPKDAEYTYCYVDLPEFGSWAKSNGYELPPEFPTRAEKETAHEFSAREKPKVLEILEALKSLTDDHAGIDQSKLPKEMKRLILQHYGAEPTKVGLGKDLDLIGLCISRPTLSKYFDIAFEK